MHDSKLILFAMLNKGNATLEPLLLEVDFQHANFWNEEKLPKMIDWKVFCAFVAKQLNLSSIWKFSSDIDRSGREVAWMTSGKDFHTFQAVFRFQSKWWCYIWSSECMESSQCNSFWFTLTFKYECISHLPSVKENSQLLKFCSFHNVVERDCQYNFCTICKLLFYLLHVQHKLMKIP